LRKANRMFKVLYKCNEALIFAKDEKELLNDICNIIVKDGGYSLAWVGYAEEGKKVKVAAACGKHTDYVKKIKVSWGKSEFGKGPTGTAIKTGKPYIERDIEHGKSYSPWQGRAMKYGFKSSIALPLITNGKTIGALNIYSGERNAFDKEEVALLFQLAGDLAYGIISLRNKAEREEMEEKLKKERAQLLSIFEGIDEPIYVADPETYEILYGNNVMRKIFGKDIIGKKCYETFQKLDKPCDFCTNDKIFGKNFGKTYVWEFRNKMNGRWYRCIDRGITWPDGRKAKIEVAMDITDRVEAEEETKRALELEKQFKLEAAHYFFNPIAIAKGYLDLAIDEVPEKQKEKLKAAKHAIARVEKVVKNEGNEPDLVIMDLNLSGEKGIDGIELHKEGKGKRIDGVSATKQIMKINSDVVIWGYTAWSDTEWSGKLRGAGAKKIVKRLISFKEFAEMVADFIRE